MIRPVSLSPANPPVSQPSQGCWSSSIGAISLDLGPEYAKRARQHAPQAIIAIDPYHVVALGNRALAEVRRRR